LLENVDLGQAIGRKMRRPLRGSMSDAKTKKWKREKPQELQLSSNVTIPGIPSL